MREIIAEIVTIGDEILYGQITDTNSQWLAEQVGLLGIKVKRKVSVGDQLEELLTIFAESESRSDIIILTGGLGPTSDDITKPALCQYFQCGLTMDEAVLKHVTEFFEKRGRPMLEINKMQAAIPDVSHVLFNSLGTAPGLWIERNGKVFISLPGVPFEMKEIMNSSGLPKLKTFFQPPSIQHQIIRTIGIGESFLAEKIKGWEEKLPSFVKLAYLPSIGGVKLRLTGFGPELETISKALLEQALAAKEIIGTNVYSLRDIELEKALGELLTENKLTIATAESCTGGAVASILTSVPGSSRYFVGSIVAYSNEVKMKSLGVQATTLQHYGAVSEQTVIEMAEGVRKRVGTDIGISTSGIAGPDGGSPEKPVGTVWLAYSDKHKTITKKLQLGKDRAVNIRFSTMYALNLVRESLSS